jgi:hypothetical protein
MDILLVVVATSIVVLGISLAAMFWLNKSINQTGR